MAITVGIDEVETERDKVDLPMWPHCSCWCCVFFFFFDLCHNKRMFLGHSLQTYRKQNYRREKCEIGETQLVGGINKIEIFSKSWKWKQKYKK
jgi:hypothetical protein